MLTNSSAFLKKADKGNYAIGGFNVNNMELLQAIVEAGVEKKSPLIIQTSQGAIKYAGIEMLGAMVHSIAKDVKIPIAFHLDHGTDVDLVKEAINSGLYTSVMIDASSKPFDENVRITRSIVKAAHKKGIWVEAELGSIPGKEDDVDVLDKDAFFTDPEEAGAFVELTECDALAVSIGTKHGVFKYSGGRAKLDVKRLIEIKKYTQVPLVLHGASEIPTELKKVVEQYGADLSDAFGVSARVLKKSIANGVNKVNTDSDLRIAFTGGVDRFMTKNPNNMDPRKYLAAGREATKKAVMRRIDQLGSTNKA
ncbi:MAG: class II fructose-bisphosphate aldolase [Opitutales bacterium]|jgi:fructose-bisphosphate aldolase, class II|nr:class II fructose-bisphosphate aldolase [Candidatus Uhrbacteria bacterium]MBT7867590.1 class II fructose-bisphosphate aldolase [Opitutales bacterium]